MMNFDIFFASSSASEILPAEPGILQYSENKQEQGWEVCVSP
jgi:hypothetical protein